MLILPDEVLARVGLRAVTGSLWGLWLTLAVTESPDRNSFQWRGGRRDGDPARVPADSLGMGGEGGEMMRDEDGQGNGAPRRVSKRLRLPPLPFSFHHATLATRREGKGRRNLAFGARREPGRAGRGGNLPEGDGTLHRRKICVPLRRGRDAARASPSTRLSPCCRTGREKGRPRPDRKGGGAHSLNKGGASRDVLVAGDLAFPQIPAPLLSHSWTTTVLVHEVPAHGARW